MKQKKTVLPTKGNKCLLLHYQPRFPGEKTKKVMHETKKQDYQQKEVRAFYFTINPVSQARSQKIKYFMAYTFILTTNLKLGYYDKSKINPRKALFYFPPVHIRLACRLIIFLL